MVVTRRNVRPPLSGSARLAIGFAALIACGTGLLSLPMASEGPQLSLTDALFTSTSAVCVTGLSTIDIGTRLTFFGQAVVLGLIQLGGLGITTVSTFMLLAAGRVTLSHQMHTQDQFAGVRVKPTQLLRWVVTVTIAAEVIGAIALTFEFGGEDRVWQGIFHSVSAFCNAGFSLHADSLTRFSGRPFILMTVMGGIVLGGMGFIVLRQSTIWVLSLFKKRRAPLYLHSRVVLGGTLLFLVLGAIMFAAMEWNNTMRDLSTDEKLLAGLFQSVTTRTAGFNSIDFSRMREPTLFFTMFLMLIGGAPGGVAGGVKVTTAMVLLSAVWSRIRGVEAVSLFKRTVPPETVQRAFQLVTMTLLFLTVILTGLLITEEGAAVINNRDDRFMVLAFEAVSAFGTVGLSAGLTPYLSVGGKLIIVVCMFVGRLGPLAAALAIVRPKTRVLYEYPREDLAVG